MVSAVQQRLIDAQLAPARVGAEISSAVAAKSLNAQKQEGAAVLQLLEGAEQAGPQAGDAMVAKATGLGSLLDMMA